MLDELDIQFDLNDRPLPFAGARFWDPRYERWLTVTTTNSTERIYYAVEDGSAMSYSFYYDGYLWKEGLLPGEPGCPAGSIHIDDLQVGRKALFRLAGTWVKETIIGIDRDGLTVKQFHPNLRWTRDKRVAFSSTLHMLWLPLKLQLPKGQLSFSFMEGK